jgi:ribitol 2-dehydrogenase
MLGSSNGEERMNELLGKVALVTGAASGIGAASAERLLQAGAQVILVDRDGEKLAAMASRLGDQTKPLQVDLLSPTDVASIPGRAVELCGQLDIVHLNAGLYVGGDILGGDADAWDRMLALNVNSVFRLARDILPHMVSRQTGDIVVTSSIAGHIAVAHEPVYSASKHAVQAFVHGLRRQVAPHGIRVGEVSPGIAITPLLDSWTPENRKNLLEGKGGLPPEEIAEAVMFMLTRPRHVTVRDIVILPQNQDI